MATIPSTANAKRSGIGQGTVLQGKPTLRRSETVSALGSAGVPRAPCEVQNPAPPLRGSLHHPEAVRRRKAMPKPTEGAFSVATAQLLPQAYDVSVQLSDFSCGLPATSALMSAGRAHCVTGRREPAAGDDG